MGDGAKFLFGLAIMAAITGTLLLLSAVATDQLRWMYYGWAALVSAGAVAALFQSFRRK